jgi:biotin carboxyl carrier protein
VNLFQKYTAHFPDGERQIEVAHDGETFLVRPSGSDRDAGGAEKAVTWDEQGGGRVLLRIDGRPVECRLTPIPGGALRIEWRGRQVTVRVADDLTERARLAHAQHGGPIPLRSPMPGMVVKVLVAEGDLVQLEQPLCIVEAMKMQNELDAPVSGRVVHLSARPGQAVEADQLLLEIRPE